MYGGRDTTFEEVEDVSEVVEEPVNVGTMLSSVFERLGRYGGVTVGLSGCRPWNVVSAARLVPGTDGVRYDGVEGGW